MNIVYFYLEFNVFDKRLTQQKHNFTGMIRGNPKTLTPGPLTLTTDRVDGLPTDRSTDYPYGPPTDHSQKRIKNKNKHITYCFSNRSLVSAKFGALR